MKRKVIVVTDGDNKARRAVEVAAKNVGARCISASAGNPTPVSGKELVDLVKEAKHDPVIVMFDDMGFPEQGKGEKALQVLVNHNDIEVLGAVAVASNLKNCEKVKADFCITKEGRIIAEPVDKQGDVEGLGHHYLDGDTVSVLSELNLPVIVGIGDLGKQDGYDSWQRGAPITTKAFREILKRGDNVYGNS